MFDLRATFVSSGVTLDYRAVFDAAWTYPDLFNPSPWTWAVNSQQLNDGTRGGQDFELVSGVWTPTDFFIVAPNFYDGDGVSEWSIDLGAAQIPGELQVALYKFSNGDPEAPDDLSTYPIEPGSWATGSLPTSSADPSTTDNYFGVRLRFIPGPLTGL